MQVVVLAQHQRNTIVSFSLQSDTTLLSLEQCDISVAFFIFAKRYFPISARDYRLLQKVAEACVRISFDKILVGVQSSKFSATYKILVVQNFLAVGTIDSHRVVGCTSDAEVQMVREHEFNYK